jgi:hypothetical protein
MTGRRAVVRPDRGEGVGARIVASLLAALGAAAAIGLAWLAARGADAPVRVDPSLVVAITAGAGVLVGIVVSQLALAALPVAAGLRAWIALIWVLALGCAIAGVVSHHPYPAPRLGVLDVPSLVNPDVWTGPRLMIGIAPHFAVVTAGVARWAGAGRIGVSRSGFAGPAVVAAAYLIAGPGEGADRAQQFDPYLASLLATGAGLIASVLVAMPGRRGARPKPARQAKEAKDRKGGKAGRPDEHQPLYGDLISPEPPPMPASFGAYSYMDGAPVSFRDNPISPASPASPARPEPATSGRRGAMDYPTSEQAVVQTYPGGYSGRLDDPVETNPAGVGGQGPLIGQPASSDAHTSWLREIGSPGKHSADRR